MSKKRGWVHVTEKWAAVVRKNMNFVVKRPKFKF